VPIPQPIPIQSLSDPRIADYANLRDRQLRQIHHPGTHSGIFIAEGELVVRQLIESPLKVRSILLTPQRLATMQDAFAALRVPTPVYLADQALMNQIVGFNIHRGILAAGNRPVPPDLDAMLPRLRTLTILENLANHDNIGGIFRAAAALAGLSSSAILLSPQCADPLYRKAIRVSMGAALRLPFAILDPWPDCLHILKRHGFTLIALTPEGATDLGHATSELLHGLRPALLLGAEGPGLSPQTLAAADLTVRIPMHPGADSLNVVTAAAIALHTLSTPPRP
jgi:tRNA G18 (ribose-2'-O)-methylase SpoU